LRSVSARLSLRASAKLSDYVVECAWSPDGQTLAVAQGDGAIELVDAGQGGAVRHLGAHSTGALALDWFVDGATICSSGQDGSLQFWPVTRPASKPVIHRGRQWTTQIKCRPARMELATSAGRAITLWSADGTRVRELAEQTSVIQAIAWSQDAKLLAAACTGTMVLYRFDGAAVQAMRFAWPGASLTVAFSPNGRYVAAGMQDGAVRFRRLAAQSSAELSGYDSKVTVLDWTSNSRFLATGLGDEIVVWDFSGRGPEGREPGRLRGHTDRVVALAAHPSNGLVASAGRDWRIAVWEPGAQEVPLDVHMARAEPSVMRWSGDGKRLAVGHASGDLAIYELS
jgi:WD40 repeat protein